jgi:hypothetical protein
VAARLPIAQSIERLTRHGLSINSQQPKGLPVHAGGLYFLRGPARFILWVERDEPIFEISNCHLEVFNTHSERPCDHGVGRVRSIENPRTLLFNADVDTEESVHPNKAHIGGRGINTLTGAAAVAPIGGAAFHDNKCWVKKAEPSAVSNS